MSRYSTLRPCQVERSEEESAIGSDRTLTIGAWAFMVLSYLLAYVVILDPASTLSTVLSMQPPFAPILMPVGMSGGDAAAWQVGLALVLSVVSTVGLTWIAGRIYGNSVLRLGTRIRFRDALVSYFARSRAVLLGDNAPDLDSTLSVSVDSRPGSGIHDSCS